jgi:hypothetical protein
MQAKVIGNAGREIPVIFQSPTPEPNDNVAELFALLTLLTYRGYAWLIEGLTACSCLASRTQVRQPLKALSGRPPSQYIQSQRQCPEVML